jgi:glycosyltransferase involved in cell wall biosynthesis
MRILSVLVGAAARLGGPVVFVGESAGELTLRGATVQIFSTDAALAPWGWLQRQRRVAPDELHPSLEDVDLQLFETRFPRRLAYSPALGRALRHAVPSFDVVHIHNLWQFPQYAAFKAARDAGVPYVVSPHGGLDPYLRRRGRARKALTMSLWQREMLTRASILHVTTAAEERHIADIAPNVARSVVPCGLHTEDFSETPPPVEFREQHLNGYDGPLVVFLGRVTEKKGVDILIRSIAEVRRRVPARLAVVGPDDSGLRPTLERLAADLGIRGSVCFIDGAYGRDRLAALSAADVWALSSHTENFGIAVAEAMAAGCPVVISPGVSLSEDVAAADAGVIAPADPGGFAAGLLAVLTDGQRRQRLRETARAFASRYDWSVVGPQLAEMYRRAAEPAAPLSAVR